MDVDGGSLVYDSSSSIHSEEDMSDLRRGPWTVEEDFTLMNYIDKHGEGRWNTLARCAVTISNRKSCRLRWLNYLRPDVRRGNITLEEQLLILELHSRWGNRWSKIAQHLPGRTDNEIKNYWRTRVQKHAKQLKCDVNSKQFKDTMRYLWMPRLVERIQAASASATATTAAASSSSTNVAQMIPATAASIEQVMPRGTYTPENSCAGASSDSFGTQGSDHVAQECYYPNGSDYAVNYNSAPQDCYYPVVNDQVAFGGNSLTSPYGYFNPGMDFQGLEQSSNQSMFDGVGDTSDNLWNVEDIWFLQQLNM